MSNQSVLQQDEVCKKCGKELPKGSFARYDEFNDVVYCEECFDELPEPDLDAFEEAVEDAK
jgi:NAD-dependent SIR2 family protein deacetylase